MNFLLNTLSLLSGLTTSDVQLRCYKQSFDNYVTTSLDQPGPILDCIDPDLDTAFYAFGVGGVPTGPAVEEVVTALLCTLRFNVITVDWSKDAAVGPLGTAVSYGIAVPKALNIGCTLGENLVNLAKSCQGSDKCLDTSKLYFIGHSLGAHLVGEAGRCAQNAGVTVPRITGLDPSGPLFETPGSHALDRSCASFVDIIHTDPCNLGTSRSTGTVDIFANPKENCPYRQCGCPETPPGQIDEQGRCSHDLAWKLYGAGVRNRASFLAASAATASMWLQGYGNDRDLAVIGIDVNFNAKGNYYMRTNCSSPYGLGQDGTEPN